MNEPSHINEIMPDALESLGEKFYVNYLRNVIIQDWNEIVGEKIANKVEPLRIDFKTLIVYCKNSSFRTIFYAQRSDIIKKINAYVKKNLVEDIAFSNVKLEVKKSKQLEVKKDFDFATEIRKMILTDEELAEIKKSCENIDDDELRSIMIKTAISHIKLQKYRRKNGWHDCKNCGVVCPPEDDLCERCKRLKYENFERTVINIFREKPFYNYADIQKEIENKNSEMIDECTAENVENIRNKFVQHLCQMVNSEKQDDINFLVMLFKRAKPEDLNENLIKNTLYELRYDLPMKGRLKIVN